MHKSFASPKPVVKVIDSEQSTSAKWSHSMDIAFIALYREVVAQPHYMASGGKGSLDNCFITVHCVVVNFLFLF